MRIKTKQTWSKFQRILRLAMFEQNRKEGKSVAFYGINLRFMSILTFLKMDIEGCFNFYEKGNENSIVMKKC